MRLSAVRKVLETLVFQELGIFETLGSKISHGASKKIADVRTHLRKVSKEDFIGGIRAEIPHKNILIDNSFSANLASMCREFKFDGGPAHE